MSLKIFKRKRVVSSVKDMNSIMKCAEYYGLQVVKLGRGQPFKTLESWKAANSQNVNLSAYMIIELKDTKLEITTRYYAKYLPYGTPCTYIFDLNDEEIFSKSGLDCFKEFSKAHKIPKADTYNYDRLNRYYDNETGKYACSARPILDFNKKFENQPLENCYEYDLNSAYAATLLKKMPDLWNPRVAQYPDLIRVKKDEVGFLLDNDLTMVNAGGEADICFKLINTPTKLLNWLTSWYNKKKEAEGVDKLEAKAMLNLPIGYSQRYNPFLRSYVVHKCNEVINDLIDEDTLFWNTDAIFSRKRRPELVLGSEIGQFKEIECKKLAYIGNVYQINDEVPVYRGICKAWFTAFEKKNGRKYDLLKDYNTSIACVNYYELDWDKLEIGVSKEWLN